MATPTFVGDAGVHKDPFLALGICDGGRDAEFLADAVRKGLMGNRSLADARADFERRRNDASAKDYQDNIISARPRGRDHAREETDGDDSGDELAGLCTLDRVLDVHCQRERTKQVHFGDRLDQMRVESRG